MNLFMCWQLFVVTLTKITLCNGGVLHEEVKNQNPTFRVLIAAILHRESPNDERMQHGGGKSEIASGNGIKGINYGFFGSFNYDFLHPHKQHPAPSTTVTTRQTTTSGCPAIITPDMCQFNTGICGFNTTCSFNEICCKGSDMAFSCCVQLGATPPVTHSTTTTGYPSTTSEVWTSTTEKPGECPYYFSYSMCYGYEYNCSRQLDCYSEEICCKTNNLTVCCLIYPTSTSSPAEAPTTEEPTTYGLTYCPYYIQESNCTYDTYPCGYYEKCYENYKCCRYSYQNPTCCIYDYFTTSTDTSSIVTDELLPCNIPSGISYVYYGSSCNSCYLYTDSSCCNWSYGPGCYSWVIPTSTISPAG